MLWNGCQIFCFHGTRLILILSKASPVLTKILDISCGIPTLLLQLKRLGFTNLSGADDDHFQPRIVQAAKAFSEIFNLNATFYDIRTGYPRKYRAIDKQFDVISQFGAATYTILTLIDPILKPGGWFVSETVTTKPPKNFAEKYEIITRDFDIGRRLKEWNGAVVVHRKRDVTISTTSRNFWEYAS